VQTLNEFIIRAPRLDDAPAVAALIEARDRADFDEERPIAFTGEQFRDWWARAPERLDTDMWLVLAGEQVAGWAAADQEGEVANIADESGVHPDFRGRGIGGRLADLAESWARERSLPRLHMHAVNDEGRRLFESRGFELVRYFWRMEIFLDDEPAWTEPPDGFTIRPYEPGVDDEKLYAMHQEAFAEHWEFTPQPFEGWLRWRTTRSDYSPELWQLGFEGEELAGAALGFGQTGLGWILDLAVAPKWRKRGLGLALLQRSFHELYRAGFTQIGLEVDSENETGATRLYERAGMRVTRRYSTFEKQMVSV
jgi:mycothiol synthase